MDQPGNTAPSSPALSELRPIKDLQRELANIFPTRGSLEWELRQHRRAYIDGGAIFEIAGRLVAHPATFQRIAIEIGARKLASRIDSDAAPA
jgi:hypothetical protein